VKLVTMIASAWVGLYAAGQFVRALAPSAASPG
jgi:hypothetical protein